jgi:SAM-dependent methyltransferase
MPFDDVPSPGRTYPGGGGLTGAEYRSFYDERRGETYSQDYAHMRAEDHPHHAVLRAFIERFDLRNKTCLEIGSSGGFFQDMVEDYWGTDIAHSLKPHYHKPYRVTEGSRYPFDDHMFDAIWTITVYEHVPELNEAMLEIDRLLKPGGVVLFMPAWQCRPWAAGGYGVRPYRELDWKGKLIKASIPVRNSATWRAIWIFPKRLWRHAGFLMGRRYHEILYRRLNPNYQVFWQSDSDACNSIDPHDAILWFRSHGFECLSHPTQLSAFLVRTGALVFRKGS